MRQQSVPAAGGDVIRLDGVTKTYQAKSTLLNLIAGLDQPTAGACGGIAWDP